MVCLFLLFHESLVFHFRTDGVLCLRVLRKGRKNNIDDKKKKIEREQVVHGVVTHHLLTVPSQILVSAPLLPRPAVLWSEQGRFIAKHAPLCC